MKIGDRVKLSAAGIKANLYPESQDRLGTITSLKGSMNTKDAVCGVLRDGSKSSVRYAMVFWEAASADRRKTCTCGESKIIHRNDGPCYYL